MNKVILMGRLTRDPDIRYSTGQQPMAIARYTLAVDSRRKDAQGNYQADFINCVAFGKAAEFAEKYLHQGSKILVSGRWQTGSYTNKDNQKVYTNECMIDEQEFAESKGSTDQRSSGQPQAQQPAEQTYQQMGMNDGFMAIPDDVGDEGLPFN